MRTKIILTSLFLSLLTIQSYAQVDTSGDQDNLENLLDSGQTKTPDRYVTATFKSTRVINGQSIENLGAGVLDFRIAHRFGTLNTGAKNFFGLDNATTKLAFDYGITNWLMVGIGRSTYQKEFDGFAKIRLLRQRQHKTMSVGISYVGAAYIQTLPLSNINIPSGEKYYFSNRVAYMNQLLIAKKFSNSFSLQIMPTQLHYNLVDSTKDNNNIFSLGVSGRVKLSNRITLTGEYFYTINPLSEYGGQQVHNALGVGIDIETGGHVFQLIFTNSTGLTERTVVGQTTGQWSNGDIHFGFNISRVFTIVQPKEFKNSRNKIW